jgi:hypothetical protein
MSWLARIWWRSIAKREAWDYLSNPNLSQETFVSVMLDLRKEVQGERDAWQRIRKLHKIL